MTIKRLGIREAKRMAFKMAAAAVNDMDFDGLFGDDAVQRAAWQDDGEEILSRAQFEVVNAIQKLGGKDAD